MNRTEKTKSIKKTLNNCQKNINKIFRSQPTTTNSSWKKVRNSILNYTRTMRQQIRLINSEALPISVKNIETDIKLYTNKMEQKFPSKPHSRGSDTVHAFFNHETDNVVQRSYPY